VSLELFVATHHNEMLPSFTGPCTLHHRILAQNRNDSIWLLVTLATLNFLENPCIALQTSDQYSPENWIENWTSWITHKQWHFLP